MEPFCYGLSNSTGKRVIAAGEPVVKIVVLSGVENQFESLVVLTINGRVLLRSADGRKSSRAKPDLFFDPVSNSGPIVIDAR